MKARPWPGLIYDQKRFTFTSMSTATVEEFQKNAAAFLAAVERGEQVIIGRDRQPVARLLPIQNDERPERERKAWRDAALQNLARAYGPDEPEYSAGMVIEPNPHYRPSSRRLLRLSHKIC